MIEISRIETKLGKKIEKNNVIEKQFSLKRNSIEKLVGIQKRYISTLLPLTTSQIQKGMIEIKYKYKKNIKFRDKLICLIL